MIPSVFVSSTIHELHHLRDAIRDMVAELGYIPVMSEYGEIGYLPTSSAEDSCYVAIRQCHLAILIIGKHYGDPTRLGMSVTHKEFRSAREARIPVITLIDREVLSFRTVYEANSADGTNVTIPGMDNPPQLFSFIKEVASAEVNNGFQAYANVMDARDRVRRQLALLFGDLLENRTGGIVPTVMDILAEIRTLRHELPARDAEFRPFLRVMRFLIEERHKSLSKLIKTVCGDLELGIPLILASPDVDSFVSAAGWRIEVLDEIDPSEVTPINEDSDVLFMNMFVVGHSPEDEIAMWYAKRDRSIVMDYSAHSYFERMYQRAKSASKVDG